MKVTGPGAGTAAGAVRRTGKTDKSEQGKGVFRQALAEALDGLGAAPAVDGVANVGAVDALFLVQSVSETDEREARRQLVRRGEEILDRLEDIRLGLLMGEVPVARLETLAQMMRARRATCADPRLGALLDEIELRAEVELAKLSLRP